MKYIESNTVELKQSLTDDVKEEIIAFLNSYLGGTIYIGVDDSGNIVSRTAKENDNDESKVINWIRDEAIYPNCSNYVNVHTNHDGILQIDIEPGKDITTKPRV